MSTIDQKEYLKKYLRVGKAPGEKKKKKKSKGISKGLKIVDDNDLPSIEEEIKQDLANDDEDTPQIVAIIDDRPPSLRIDEEHKKLWKPIVEIEDEDIKPDVTQSLKLSSSFKLNKLVKSEENYSKREKNSSFKKPSNKRVKEEPRYDDYDDGKSKRSSPIRKIKDEPLSPDSSPLRKDKTNNTIDSDSSPPRKAKRDSSPSIKTEHDSSPPRRGQKNSDSSPPRKRNQDNSPPRRTKNYDSSPPRKKGHDSSPPRRMRKSSDSSPPRKRNHDNSPVRRTKDCDSSPPRKKGHDSSPPRRMRKNSDSSPPRKRNHDSSPPRKNRYESSPSRRNKYDSSTSSHRLNYNSKNKRKHDEGKETQSPKRSDKRSRWGSQEKDTTEKMKTTLDGKKSGLQRATELIQEMERIKKQEEEMFKNISSDISGQNAATIVRGKKRDAEDIEEEKRKQQKEKEMKEKYNKWGKGLKQVEDINEKIASDIHEMNKPLARYADDEDLEKYLKEQEREGDPMLAYLRKKKKKKAVEEKVPEKPMYMGEFMPNRFGIRPGYRWDGVDRSNGYEKKWFEVQNKKKASLEESYKWSTEDM